MDRDFDANIVVKAVACIENVPKDFFSDARSALYVTILCYRKENNSEIIFFDISKGMLKVFEVSDNLEPSKMIF